ncbi:glycosyltransferase [Oerskovia turbata]|uniref:Glycosyltransferase n=1 Tax=Oerskovia turbata TaxID=1713 RepID=A0A4Q1KW41_9CELL|nr:glycosyltransferase [Oerskovia turbata]RXR26730.1 glycosyltransferase [Oerskovia turbata]RXR34463.1 glycosyltransferase [Oerskovia turbata]TGJ97742.1 glycosyl transferase family 2 [Actinotalea fermentans ATCC 43279 = JCM 9966 = DSM 3133]
MSVAPPVVDVVVAVHDVRRRIDRGVGSLLQGTRTPVRVTVVAHGIASEQVSEALGASAADGRVRIVELDDGVRSPAGPFNHGLDLAEADWVSIMGSDDFLEPGALDAWVAHVRAHGTDYLIAPLRDQSGAVWRDPLTRPRRTGALDPAKDRLDYRAAPLGLVRRTYLEEVGVRLTEGLATGEDIELGLALLNKGGRVDHVPTLPAYVIGQDAPVRVTFAERSFADEMSALEHLTSVRWPLELPPAHRRAMAIKLWRLNVLPAVLLRPDADQWDVADREALARVARWLRSLSPDAERSLSRAEHRVVAVADGTDVSEVVAAVRAVGAAGPSDRAVAASLGHTLARDALLRRALRMRLGR